MKLDDMLKLEAGIASALDEMARKGATDWGKLNDGMVALSTAIDRARRSRGMTRVEAIVEFCVEARAEKATLKGSALCARACLALGLDPEESYQVARSLSINFESKDPSDVSLLTRAWRSFCRVVGIVEPVIKA